MKSIIIFDLDGTLAESKSPLDSDMKKALEALLVRYKVAIVSGAAFPQFEKQVLSHLSVEQKLLSNLYIFPTNGSSMRVYKNNEWHTVYDEVLSEEDRKRIIDAVSKSVEEAGLSTMKTYGPQIEDRKSQITFSAVGQEAPVSVKSMFDPDQKKRLILRKSIEEKIPEFEVKIGGMTSIDITRKGIDKRYAIEKIEKELSIPKENMLFIGDAIFPGGNDYAAKEAGVETIKVDNPHDTVKVIHHLLTA